MSTHPIEPEAPDPSTPARVALIEAIGQCQLTAPGLHYTASYAVAPYLAWLKAMSNDPDQEAIHLAYLAEQAIAALAAGGHRVDLKELGIQIVESLTTP